MRTHLQPAATLDASRFAPAGGSLLQRKCECGGSAGLSGRCEECQHEQLVGLRKKTEAAKAGDHFEQEADRLAERVTGMPEPKSQTRAASHGGAHGDAASLVGDALRSAGQPLDSATRAFMESGFGHDFSRVRVHSDARASESARAVSAQAYTVGRDVVFGAGRYAPSTGAGRWLLAHELAHVVQQRAAPEAQAAPAAGAATARTHASSRGPALQRKLLVDEEAQAGGPSLKASVERLAGRALVPAEGGLKLAEGAAAGGSPTVARFIERAVASGQTYRLRWRAAETATPVAQTPPQPQTPTTTTTPTPAQPQQPAQPQAQAATVEQVNGEIVITVNRAMLGEYVWTADEVVAEQLVAAVTRFDPSTKAVPPAVRTSTGQPLPEVSEDALLSATAESDDQGAKQDHLRAFIDANLTHLTPAQRKLVYEAGWRTRGVPVTEVIRGVETNTPFRMTQQIVGDRVTVTYVDPRTLPADADQLDTMGFISILDGMSRRVTFVPGADETAGPAEMPMTGEACTDAELRSPLNSCCTPQMLAEFGTHLSTARASVARAVKRLEGTDLIDCRVRPHFGGRTSPPALAQIASKLRLAASELFVSRHAWRCRAKGSGLLGCEDRTVEGGQRGTVGANVQRGMTHINICINEQAPFSNWVTLLHEVMHRVGVNGTEIYKHDSGYPGGDPMSNADSYARLVEDLGGASWSPCNPWPVDLKAVGGIAPDSGYVLGARLEGTPLGPGVRIVDWTLGVNFLWMPKTGVVSEAGDEKKDVLGRGYAGVETGVRLTLPNRYGSLVFQAAGGGGGLLEGEDVQPALMGRAGAGWRFGKELSGPEIGIELSRLQSLTERANGDWVIGISAGYHFGRSEKRK